MAPIPRYLCAHLTCGRCPLSNAPIFFLVPNNATCQWLPPPCAASDMLLLRNCDLLAAAADGKYVLLPFFFSAAPFVRFLRASFFFEEFQSPASAALFSLPSRSSIKYYVPVLLRAMNSQIFPNQHSAPLSNAPFQKKTSHFI